MAVADVGQSLDHLERGTLVRQSAGIRAVQGIDLCRWNIELGEQLGIAAGEPLEHHRCALLDACRAENVVPLQELGRAGLDLDPRHQALA
ncbi:hypothetical protein D3C80_1988560 [compost metagenome]